MIRNVAIETNTNLKKAVSRGKIMSVEPEVIKSSFTGLMNFLSGYYATPIELPLGPWKGIPMFKENTVELKCQHVEYS